MPLPRPCLSCGIPTPGSYCPPCARVRERQRVAHRPSEYASPARAMRRALNAQGWGVCYICGRAFPAPALEVDHKVPLHRGGRDEESNLGPACLPCHRAKTAKERLGQGGGV